MAPQRDDDELEVLLAHVLDRSRSDQARELETVCAREPQLAGELRRRYAALDSAGFLIDDSEVAHAERFGDFQVLGPLGSGGMGAVFLATQLSLRREVALKLMRPELLFLPQARERFRREADAIARLKHPGIVPVYATGEERGQPYFAMERIEGATLADVLNSLRGRDASTLSGRDLAHCVSHGATKSVSESDNLFTRPWPAACAEIVRQVAEALAHAHEQHVLHRDVKPANIALDVHGRARLFDFGLALAADAERDARTRLTASAAQLGTLLYMAPEQVRGLQANERSDVYSLGVTLRELLLLEAPFDAPTPHKIEERILAGDATPFPRATRIPADLELVCRTATELDPARRYASARHFARDLEHVLAHRPIDARPVGWRVRTARWMQRHPAWSVGLALGALLLVGVPSALWWQQRAHTRELERSLSAEREARQHEREALEDAEISARFMTNLLLAASPERAKGRDRTVLEMLEDGKQTLHELDAYPAMQARAMIVLGDAFGSLARYDDALDLLRGGLALERTQRGRLGTASLRALNKLATVLQRQARLDEAEPLFRESLAGNEALHGHVHAAVAVAACNLGGVLLERGQKDEALALMTDAIAIYAALGDPKDAEALSTCCLNVAYMRAKAGDAEGSAELVERALRTARARKSEADPYLATTLALAARVHELGSRLEPADELAREALDVSLRVFGPAHDAVANAQFYAASIAEARGERERALTLFEASVSTMETLGMGENPRAKTFRERRDRLREAGSQR